MKGLSDPVTANDFSRLAKDFSLSGKVALITGGSRGIGQATAEVFIEAGARVLLTARKEDGLRDAVERLPSGMAAYHVANASDPDAGQACVDATMNQFGRVDILVNNAATNPASVPIRELTAAQFDKTVAVNQRAPLLYGKAAANAWMLENGGVILNVSSAGAYVSTHDMATYGATKAALNKLTMHMALEFAPKVRVVGIAPGMIETHMMRGLNGIDERKTRILVRRIGEPREVALLALLLASDAGAFINGTTVLIDGGASVR
jgi:NAD(P)-dependent dehydrogenase (short-subunit alcohol dehydrogenase family)